MKLVIITNWNAISTGYSAIKVSLTHEIQMDLERRRTVQAQNRVALAATERQERQAQIAAEEDMRQAQIAAEEDMRQAQIAAEEDMRQAQIAAEEDMRQAQIAAEEEEHNAKILNFLKEHAVPIRKWLNSYNDGLALSCTNSSIVLKHILRCMHSRPGMTEEQWAEHGSPSWVEGPLCTFQHARLLHSQYKQLHQLYCDIWQGTSRLEIKPTSSLGHPEGGTSAPQSGSGDANPDYATPGEAKQRAIVPEAPCADTSTSSLSLHLPVLIPVDHLKGPRPIPLMDGAGKCSPVTIANVMQSEQPLKVHDAVLCLTSPMLQTLRDLVCRTQRKDALAVLLGGATGRGKSTLLFLLATLIALFGEDDLLYVRRASDIIAGAESVVLSVVMFGSGPLARAVLLGEQALQSTCTPHLPTRAHTGLGAPVELLRTHYLSKALRAVREYFDIGANSTIRSMAQSSVLIVDEVHTLIDGVPLDADTSQYVHLLQLLEGTAHCVLSSCHAEELVQWLLRLCNPVTSSRAASPETQLSSSNSKQRHSGAQDWAMSAQQQAAIAAWGQLQNQFGQQGGRDVRASPVVLHGFQLFQRSTAISQAVRPRQQADLLRPEDALESSSPEKSNESAVFEALKIGTAVSTLINAGAIAKLASTANIAAKTVKAMIGKDVKDWGPLAAACTDPTDTALVFTDILSQAKKPVPFNIQSHPSIIQPELVACFARGGVCGEDDSAFLVHTADNCPGHDMLCVRRRGQACFVDIVETTRSRLQAHARGRLIGKWATHAPPGVDSCFHDLLATVYLAKCIISRDEITGKYRLLLAKPPAMGAGCSDPCQGTCKQHYIHDTLVNCLLALMGVKQAIRLSFHSSEMDKDDSKPAAAAAALCAAACSVAAEPRRSERQAAFPVQHGTTCDMSETTQSELFESSVGDESYTPSLEQCLQGSADEPAQLQPGQDDSPQFIRYTVEPSDNAEVFHGPDAVGMVDASIRQVFMSGQSASMQSEQYFTHVQGDVLHYAFKESQRTNTHLNHIKRSRTHQPAPASGHFPNVSAIAQHGSQSSSPFLSRSCSPLAAVTAAVAAAGEAAGGT